jgi:glycopeptide antibiotics resistance protein
VPLGIYAGILFKRLTFSKNVLLFFSASLIVEALQYVLRLGAFDVTDLITNTAGGILGLLIFKTFERVFHDRVRAQWFINIFAATGTVLMVLLLLLLKMNLLPVRFQ